MIRVCVAGVTGWTGAAVAEAIDSADDLDLVSGVARSDPRRFSSVTEALDAVDRNGRVEVEARPVADDDILITVSDTGHGITPDDLRRIFEPFYTTKGRGKGTGLGLAICRQLTAALGGTISVESAAGKGSTFFVRLPRQGPPVADARPRAAGGRA